MRDSMGNRFFRIRPPAYQFLCELERTATVGEAWERSLDASPEEAPGQGEIVRLLSQLHQAGLLRSDLEGDVASIFATQDKEHRKKVAQQWSSLLFIRIPLFNPDRFLKRTLPYVRWLISGFGVVLWLVVFGLAVKVITENWSQFRVESGNILGAHNIFWLYAAMIVIKGFHEYGHGYFCRKYGGEVPQMGIMLLLLNPLPFVDASSSWAFREKKKRILVAAAGMIVEVFLASVAAIIWTNTGQGLTHTIAHNCIVIASIGTLLFNLNPLLRFDGYHILSDILEVPNLQKRASRTTLYLMERYFFRLPTAVNPAETRTETFWLVFYFFAAFFYRILLLTGIVLLVSHWFYLIGVLLAFVFGFLWLVLPVLKAVKYLCTSPRIEARRGRAAVVSFGLVACLFAIITLIPVPYHFRAEGVVRSDPFARVFAGASGELREVLIPSGSVVEKGQALVRMTSFELDRQLELVDLDILKTTAQRRETFQSDPVRYLSLAGYLELKRSEREKIILDREALVVLAPESGLWIAQELTVKAGTTLARGTELGTIQGEESHYLAAEVRQADGDRLFGGSSERSEVKVRGQENWTLEVSDFQAIPGDRNPRSDGRNVPGLAGGGGTGLEGVEASQSQLSAEPFFEIRAVLVPRTECLLLHGQQAVARIDLPWEPLLFRWARSLRQLFQRNYRV